MTNHIHLVVQVGEVSLSRIMQSVSLRYTKWINLRHARTGHLFQGRYKALLLDADSYLLEMLRYVHLNPVRAGMVASVEEYQWSSHHCYTGKYFLPWPTMNWALSLFGQDKNSARAAYMDFVRQGMSEGKRAEFQHGICDGQIIAEDVFAEKVLGRTQRQDNDEYTLYSVIENVCRQFEITETQLRSPGKKRPFNETRALAALLVRESPHLSLTELGEFLGRDVPGLGRSAARLVDAARDNPAIGAMISESWLFLRKSESQA